MGAGGSYRPAVGTVQRLLPIRGTRWTVGVFDRLLVGRDGPLDLGLLVTKPVAGPNAMESPAETLKMILTQAVAISRSRGGVVAGAIAFDRQDHPPWLLWMLGDVVDEVARAAVLSDDIDAGG